MKIAVLFSGGKDSTYAIYQAQQEGHEVVCLVSFISKNQESYMFHVPNIEWAEKQAEAICLPFEKFETEGIKEKEVEDLTEGLAKIKEKYQIEGVAAGALASRYQKSRVDVAAEKVGIKSLALSWQAEPMDYMNNLLKLGFQIKFVGVFADGFDPSWLDRELDEESLEDLRVLNKKHGISLVGEGGEYETFACDGPIFKKRIEFEDTKVIWEENSGVLDVKTVKLIDK